MAKKDELDAPAGKPAGKNPMLVALGQRIKELRNAAGLSQRQFGEAAGMSQAYVFLLESGGPNVTVTVLSRIAAALGVSVGELLQDKDAPGVAGSLLVGVRDELRKLREQLQVRIDRDGKFLSLVEQRLAAHEEVLDALLRRDEKHTD